VQETRAWLLIYLRERPCVDRGNDDVRVLEFDHRDGATKLGAIAILAGQGIGLARVKAEVEQCDVRCANCHRVRTHVQRGWWARTSSPTSPPRSAPEGIRTPNLLIRSQVLYPLSYGRRAASGQR
jgi:hypothetical protein